MLHVCMEYLNLHEWLNSMVNVGKYSSAMGDMEHLGVDVCFFATKNGQSQHGKGKKQKKITTKSSPNPFPQAQLKSSSNSN